MSNTQIRLKVNKRHLKILFIRKQLLVKIHSSICHACINAWSTESTVKLYISKFKTIYIYIYIYIFKSVYYQSLTIQLCLMQVEGSYIGNGLKRMMWSDSRSFSIYHPPSTSLEQPAVYQPLDINCRIPAMKTPVRACHSSLLLHKSAEMTCL